MQKCQGTSTLQMDRTKKPSAKKRLKRIERRMPERGRRFFFPNPRHPSFDKPMRQRRAGKGGDVLPRTKFARIASYGNLLPERITTTKAQTHQKHKPQTYGMGTPTNQVRERGETFFLKFLALNSLGPNTTNEAEEYRKHFYQV